MSPGKSQYIQIQLYNIVKLYVLPLYGGRCQNGLGRTVFRIYESSLLTSVMSSRMVSAPSKNSTRQQKYKNRHPGYFHAECELRIHGLMFRCLEGSICPSLHGQSNRLKTLVFQ
jgi:hypothetical protein